MRHAATASVDLDLDRERWPRERFYAQAKLPGDGGEHPYGQWSLAVEPIGSRGDAMLARIAFNAAGAPHDALLVGAELELFRGPHRIGAARVAIGATRPGIEEADYLGDVRRPPRIITESKAA